MAFHFHPIPDGRISDERIERFPAGRGTTLIGAQSSAYTFRPDDRPSPIPGRGAN